MKKVSNAEELVMSVIWKSNEPVDMRTIMNAANARFKRDWKPQTVSTFLVRLRSKGFIVAEKKGRYTYYMPVVKMLDYKKMLLDEIEKMF